MSYTKPRHCIFCGDPESLCQCPPELLEFARAHVVATDDGRGVVDGDTLRILIERAQANADYLKARDDPTAALLHEGKE